MKETKLSDYAGEAAEILPRIIFLVSRDDEYSKSGLTLTIPQFRMLGVVHTRGEIAMGELSKVLQVAPPSATMTASRLVHRGLLARKTDPKDRRIVRLMLTTKGKTAVGQFLKVKKERWTEILQSLPKEEWDGMLSALRRVSDLLHQSELKAQASN